MTTGAGYRFDDDERGRIRERLGALQARTIDLDLSRACVLVPLCTVRGRASVLFTKRTETVGTHKGQVSFPGGRMDPGDADEIACALRELDEELGIPAGAVEVLGRFHEVMSITSMKVTPVIGWVGELGDLSSLSPSAAEIDAVFALSVSDLTDPAHRELRELRNGMLGPFYTAGPHVVWGLTAFILEDVLREALALDVPAMQRKSEP